MDDITSRIRLSDIRHAFPSGETGRTLADHATAMWHACRDEAARDEVERLCAKAARHAEWCFREGAFLKSRSLDEWFSLPSLGLPELARRHDTHVAAWRAAPEAMDDDVFDAREAEDDRVQALEERNAYGRTHRWVAECDDWILVRFGSLPTTGKSVFGLAREDTEDGPDPWRQELGGMTHEAGASVFRAYRHPDVDGGLILIEPDFTLARYGVDSSRAQLLSIVRDADRIDDVETFLVEGPLIRTRAADGTLRLELGSDGEYLVDGSRATQLRIPVDRVWTTPVTSVRDILMQSGRYGTDGILPLP